MTDIDFGLELTRPIWLWGALTVPFVIYYFYHSLVDLPRRQRAVSALLRSTILTLLVLSLAGLTLLKPTRELFVIFAMDQSLSVGDESNQKADSFIEQSLKHVGEHRVGFLRFADQPGLVREAKSSKPVKLDDRGTDLAAAIEVSAAAIPPFYVRRMVLLTDGNQTRGDAVKAALSAGIPISTVPLQTRDDPEVQVSAVSAPAQVAQGEPFYVEVVIDANRDGQGQVDVYRGPHKVIDQKLELKKGENRLRFRQSIDRERLAEFTVRVYGFEDTLLDNNTESALVYTAGKPRVLLVDSDTKTAKHLVWALEEEDILVDVRPPQGAPETLADLQNYELLILSNVPATDLSSRQMEVARTYVQSLGGGLIMLGGDQSFGLGGYYKTILEEILPVRSDFEKEKEKPSLAMMLVIDKSGSMGGEKIELAKDAAKSAVELLGPKDQIGIIAFDGEPFMVSEMTHCSNKGAILDQISGIEAGGGTAIYPAMEQAYNSLMSSVAKLKHCIILTDGHSAPGPFQELAQDMVAGRITASTVAVGEGADRRLLEEIAQTGRGRFYFTTDPSSIPQIFAKETVAASKSAINELPFVPQVIQPTAALANIDFDTAPFLLGYVVTRPKPTSQPILATESGDPLLTWWRYGLGMSVAFTSDAKSRWAAEWLTWPGYSKFWAQVIRQAMRKNEAKGMMVEVIRQGDQTTVMMDSTDPTGRFLNQADTQLTLIGPRLGEKKIAMRQTAPGRYVAEFETTDSGAHHLEFSQKYEGKELYRQSRGLVVGYADELRLRPTNDELLKSISRVSGGIHAPSPEEVFKETEESAMRATPLWPYLVMIALAIFVADVALRRIDFSLILPAVFARNPIAGSSRNR